MKPSSWLIVSALSATLLSATGNAHEILVPTQQPSIQAAIDAATTNDTVTILPGVYSGIGNADLSTIGKTVLVQGQKGSDSTALDCGGVFNSMGFRNVSATTRIWGLTIRNADTAVACGYSSLTIEQCRFQNCGAAISMAAGVFPLLKGNTYQGNALGIAVAAGTISGVGSWSKDGAEPYVILGDVVISEGMGNARLTLPPGLELRFMLDASLVVDFGRLSAVGKADSLIVFTSASGLTNGWDGLYFTDYSDVSGRTSTLEYCVVEKAGQGGWGQNAGIYCVSTTQPTIRNCTVRSVTGAGIALSASRPVLQSSRIEYNTGFGIYLENNSFPVNTGNSYSGNLCNIAVAAGTISGVGSWSKDGAEPYVILGDVVISEGMGNARLTLPPGLELRFMSDASLVVDYGRLSAVGKADSLIVFTSASGSTDGWDGLYFTDFSDVAGRTSTLQYCVVEKAGQGGSGQNAGIYCKNTAQPTILNCIVRMNAGDGVYLSDSPIEIRWSRIADNSGNGLRCTGSGEASSIIQHTCILENALLGIKNENTATNVTAQFNWWGSQSGPRDTSAEPPDQNVGGKGSAVSDYVLYRPWDSVAQCPCCVGVTGNVNVEGIVDLSDLSALVSYLTGGGYVLPCVREANVNVSGIVDLSDLSALVSYLTGGGYVLPSCP